MEVFLVFGFEGGRLWCVEREEGERVIERREGYRGERGGRGGEERGRQ